MRYLGYVAIVAFLVVIGLTITQQSDKSDPTVLGPSAKMDRMNGVIMEIVEDASGENIAIRLLLEEGEGEFELLSNGRTTKLEWSCEAYQGSVCKTTEGQGSLGPEPVVVKLVASDESGEGGVEVQVKGNGLYVDVWAFGVYDADRSDNTHYPYINLCQYEEDQFLNQFGEPCNVNFDNMV